MEAAFATVERHCPTELSAYVDCVDSNPGSWHATCNELKQSLSACAAKQCAPQPPACTQPASCLTRGVCAQLPGQRRQGPLQTADRAVRAMPQGQCLEPGYLHRAAEQTLRVLRRPGGRGAGAHRPRRSPAWVRVRAARCGTTVSKLDG
eukprot:scaffold83297_cov62-Phaeocystis_antarctica.AAC.2